MGLCGVRRCERDVREWNQLERARVRNEDQRLWMLSTNRKLVEAVRVVEVDLEPKTPNVTL